MRSLLRSTFGKSKCVQEICLYPRTVLVQASVFWEILSGSKDDKIVWVLHFQNAFWRRQCGRAVKGTGLVIQRPWLLVLPWPLAGFVPWYSPLYNPQQPLWNSQLVHLLLVRILKFELCSTWIICFIIPEKPQKGRGYSSIYYYYYYYYYYLLISIITCSNYYAMNLEILYEFCFCTKCMYFLWDYVAQGGCYSSRL